MTDQQILECAQEVGFNLEHRATNDCLLRFAKEVILKTEAEWIAAARTLYDTHQGVAE